MTSIVISQIKWHNEAETSLRSEQVDIDEWWKSIDSKLLEGVIYRSSIEEPIFAESIAPWIPPSCRGKVINTEYQKKGQQGCFY